MLQAVMEAVKVGERPMVIAASATHTAMLRKMYLNLCVDAYGEVLNPMPIFQSIARPDHMRGIKSLFIDHYVYESADVPDWAHHLAEETWEAIHAD
jgi:hypothetical protein